MKRTKTWLSGAILPALLTAVVACGNDDNGNATPTPTPALVPSATATQGATEAPPTLTPTATPAATATPTPTETPATTPTPEPTPPGAPSGTQSGIPEIDAILADLVSGDPAALAQHIALMETHCTHAQGLGGPPKCWALPGTPPEGTPVMAFPSASCEGSWQFDAQEIAAGIIGQELELYGVVRFDTPQPLYSSEPGYPTLDYLILLQQNQPTGMRVGTYLGVAGGQVASKSLVCLGPPEMALDRFGPATYVLYGPAYE